MSQVETRPCRFCGRNVNAKRYAGHRCTSKFTAGRQYRKYVDTGQVDGKAFPSFESFDIAIQSGAVSFPDYVGAVETRVEVEESKPEPADTGGVVIETDQGTEPIGVLPGEGGTLINGDFPVRAGPVGSPEPGVANVVSKLIGKKAEIAQIAKAGITKTKIYAWMPIVLGVSELLQYFLQGRERGLYRPLTKEERNGGCAAYQNSLGDSPLMKLRKSGDEESMDLVSWHLSVHGDLIFGGIPIVFHKLKTLRRNANVNSTSTQPTP